MLDGRPKIQIQMSVLRAGLFEAKVNCLDSPQYRLDLEEAQLYKGTLGLHRCYSELGTLVSGH